MSDDAIVVKKKRGRPRKVPEAAANPELEPQASKPQTSAKPKKTTASPTTSRSAKKASTARKTAPVASTTVKEEIANSVVKPASSKAKTSTSTSTVAKKQSPTAVPPARDSESLLDSPASTKSADEAKSDGTGELNAIEPRPEETIASPSEKSAKPQPEESTSVSGQRGAVQGKAPPVQAPTSSPQQQVASIASAQRSTGDEVEEQAVSQPQEQLGSSLSSGETVSVDSSKLEQTTAASLRKEPDEPYSSSEVDVAASMKFATGGPSSSKILSALANQQHTTVSPTPSSIAKFSTGSSNQPAGFDASGAAKMSAKQVPQSSTPSAPLTRKPRVVETLARSRPHVPSGHSRTTPFPTRPEDIRQTKEYKLAARKWISTIVALPVLFVTSYMLYERVYGSKSQKHLVKPAEPPVPKDTAHES